MTPLPHQRLSEALLLALRDLNQEAFDLVANALDQGASLGARWPLSDALALWRSQRGAWPHWSAQDRETALGMLQALEMLSPNFLEIRSSLFRFPLQELPALGMPPDDLENRLIHPILLSGIALDDFLAGCYASAALERGADGLIRPNASALFPDHQALAWMELVWTRSGLRYQDCMSNRLPSTPLAAACRAGAGLDVLTHLLDRGSDPLYSPNAPFANCALACAAETGHACAALFLLGSLRREWSDLDGALIPERLPEWSALLPSLIACCAHSPASDMPDLIAQAFQELAPWESAFELALPAISLCPEPAQSGWRLALLRARARAETLDMDAILPPGSAVAFARSAL